LLFFGKLGFVGQSLFRLMKASWPSPDLIWGFVSAIHGSDEVKELSEPGRRKSWIL
jgi:hypothetical protein